MRALLDSIGEPSEWYSVLAPAPGAAHSFQTTKQSLAHCTHCTLTHCILTHCTLAHCTLTHSVEGRIKIHRAVVSEFYVPRSPSQMLVSTRLSGVQLCVSVLPEAVCVSRGCERNLGVHPYPVPPTDLWMCVLPRTEAPGGEVVGFTVNSVRATSVS